MAGWTGKILGGALGALVGGPIGLAVGVLLGHQYDASPLAQRSPDSVRRVQQLFFPATFRVMGHIAKADGRVSEQDIAAARALMNALRLNPAQMAEAIEQYTAGKQPGFSLHGSLAALREAMRPHPQLAQFFMELQLQVAIMGNGLAPAAGRDCGAARHQHGALRTARSANALACRSGCRRATARGRCAARR
jgi:DnaJ like chaperone protein